MIKKWNTIVYCVWQHFSLAAKPSPKSTLLDCLYDYVQDRRLQSWKHYMKALIGETDSQNVLTAAVQSVFWGSAGKEKRTLLQVFGFAHVPIVSTPMPKCSILEMCFVSSMWVKFMAMLCTACVTWGSVCLICSFLLLRLTFSAVEWLFLPPKCQFSYFCSDLFTDPAR